MAIDRHGTALAMLRIAIGVFFIAESLQKLRWFVDPSILADTLTGWSHGVPATSISAGYLKIVTPAVAVLARLVPLGEFVSGLALVLGFWTPLFAFVAFFMALNFQIASGAVFKYSFLTSGYGLPVLGSTLALAFGGVHLPWSIKD